VISIVVAVSKNGVIGKKGKLPWHIPAELQYFKRITMGHPILMGRRTHEAIGRALPGRENVVITRDPAYRREGIQVFTSLQDALERYKDQELMVIGGAEIIRQCIHRADRLYLTVIDHEFAGDTFMPAFDVAEWRLVSKEKGLKDEKNPYDYYFLLYERRSRSTSHAQSGNEPDEREDGECSMDGRNH
jgi:dihydrofolate reductase